jgi:hypothetical protein
MFARNFGCLHPIIGSRIFFATSQSTAGPNVPMVRQHGRLLGTPSGPEVFAKMESTTHNCCRGGVPPKMASDLLNAMI